MNILLLLFVYCMYGGICTPWHAFDSKDNFVELVFSFYLSIGARDEMALSSSALARTNGSTQQSGCSSRITAQWPDY